MHKFLLEKERELRLGKRRKEMNKRYQKYIEWWEERQDFTRKEKNKKMMN